MDLNTDLPDRLRRRLKTTLALTRAGLIYERVAQAFWPFFSLLFLALGVRLLGLHTLPGDAALTAVSAVLAVAALVSLVMGARAFTRPTAGEVIARVDARLNGRPLQALSDAQGTQSSEASDALWRAHLERMAARVVDAKPVPPEPALAPRDPYGLRLMALTVLGMGVVFGSLGTATTVARGNADTEIAMGPIWEGWIKPPSHTGKPTLYMQDLDDRFDAPKGSEVTVRLYGTGEDGDVLELRETVSGDESATATADTDFDIQRAGEIEIDGPSGRLWNVALVPDARPTAELVEQMSRAASGETRQPYRLTDDFGVTRAVIVIERDLDAVTRRYGFAMAPEERAPLEVDVVLPQSGSRTEIDGVFAENFSEHPYSGLPVMISMRAYDAAGQESDAALGEAVLPGRRFFDPVAAALIDVRRELLWNRANAPRNAQVLRAVSYQPDGLFDAPTQLEQLKNLIDQLEADGALR